jgi:hypothetical protein
MRVWSMLSGRSYYKADEANRIAKLYRFKSDVVRKVPQFLLLLETQDIGDQVI